MNALAEACACYRHDLATTSWATNELYKFEWAHELVASVDWRHDDEAICRTVETLLRQRFGCQDAAGVNFLQAQARYGGPLMTPGVVAQLRRCADHAFADLDWTLEALPYPVLSCYVASLFPERLRPLHNTKFDLLFEYLFPERYEGFGRNGRRHVVGAQPYLESISVELFLVGKGGIDFKFYKFGRALVKDARGLVYTDGGVLVRNYYQDSDTDVHKFILSLASVFVNGGLIDERYFGGCGTSLTPQPVRPLRVAPSY